MNRNRTILLLVTMNVLLMAAFFLKDTKYSRLADTAGRAWGVPASAQPSSTQSRRTEIVAAAERVAPAVVSIGATHQAYMVNPFSHFFHDFTVYPYSEKIPYMGSGVIVDPNGLIVTNHHVVEGAKDVFVTLMNGDEHKGVVLDADEALDVALIKIDAKNLPAAKLGNSSNLLVGEWALAMGNPFGNLIGDPTPTVTLGVISALKRTFRPNDEIKRVYMDMIQTDAAINPGNSGGALINAAGELIGINTFIMSRSGGAEGIGFAIPVNRVKAVIDEILSHGRIRPRIMDFRVQNLTPNVAKMIGTDEKNGAVVSELVRGGPAEKSGLKIGDVITAVDNRPIKDAQDFTLYVWTQQVGTMVTCDVDRSGEKLKIKYELTQAKDTR